jgi:hypothetical protein
MILRHSLLEQHSALSMVGHSFLELSNASQKHFLLALELQITADLTALMCGEQELEPVDAQISGTQFGSFQILGLNSRFDH